jgi:hypothetical protein
MHNCQDPSNAHFTHLKTCTSPTARSPGPTKCPVLPVPTTGARRSQAKPGPTVARRACAAGCGHQPNSRTEGQGCLPPRTRPTSACTSMAWSMTSRCLPSTARKPSASPTPSTWSWSASAPR